jgi:hypothetical protein
MFRFKKCSNSKKNKKNKNPNFENCSKRKEICSDLIFYSDVKFVLVRILFQFENFQNFEKI